LVPSNFCNWLPFSLCVVYSASTDLLAEFKAQGKKEWVKHGWSSNRNGGRKGRGSTPPKPSHLNFSAVVAPMRELSQRSITSLLRGSSQLAFLRQFYVMLSSDSAVPGSTRQRGSTSRAELPCTVQSWSVHWMPAWQCRILSRSVLSIVVNRFWSWSCVQFCIAAVDGRRVNPESFLFVSQLKDYQGHRLLCTT